MEPTSTYYAHGKLLLTGEYAVLDGALALAVPCKFGQKLEVTPSASSRIFWESVDVEGKTWFQAEFSSHFDLITTSHPGIAKKLQSVFAVLCELNPGFLEKNHGLSIRTTLEFNRHWGLGSSSTLIHLLSQWASVNPYELLYRTFGGSGYDIACADAKGPILFQKQTSSPKAESIFFNPEWKDQLFFVYLGTKQVSSAEIVSYSAMDIDRSVFTKQITALTQQLVESQNATQFCAVLELHEALISKNLGYPTVKSERFSTINGTFKSLGAWGGDFVLFVGQKNEIPKIKALGYSTVLNWNEMIF